MKNLTYSSSRILTLVALLMAIMSISNSCSKDDDKGTNGGNNNGGSTNPNEVLMRSSSFSPSTITVTVGTNVTWRNRDGMTHTVTSDTDLFDSGNIGNNGSYSYTFNTAGTFPYHCTLHSGMTGTVIVN